MQPRKGLCLSATYDKAFENHLITFGEDYRLAVCPILRHPCPNDHVRELFEKRQGQRLHLPHDAERYPLQTYLKDHREKMVS